MRIHQLEIRGGSSLASTMYGTDFFDPGRSPLTEDIWSSKIPTSPFRMNAKSFGRCYVVLQYITEGPERLKARTSFAMKYLYAFVFVVGPDA